MEMSQLPYPRDRMKLDKSMPDIVKKIQVIFKIVERCNLVCSYCYYFFGGDESYKKRPPLLQGDVPQQLVSYLSEAIDTHEVEEIEIVFHGGEPMMLPLPRFKKACEELKAGLALKTRLSFGMQTNGTLFDEDWIEYLEELGVAIGFSIDGLKFQHDQFRVDKHGTPSFDKIVANIKSIKGKYPNTLGQSLSVINVLNPEVDYTKFLDFMYNLGIFEVSVLLPDCDLDTGPPNHITLGEVQKSLIEIYKFKEQHVDFKIRRIDELLDFFSSQIPKSHSPDQKYDIRNAIIVVHSNGQISQDDTFMPARKWYGDTEKSSLLDSTLSHFINNVSRKEIIKAFQMTPEACKECQFEPVCGGGDPENRFSKENGFNNRSVYCEDLKGLYSYACRNLYDNGYPEHLVRNVLPGLSNDFFK